MIRKYRDSRENLPRFDTISHPGSNPSKDWKIDARRIFGVLGKWHRWGGDDDRGTFSHSISPISSLSATQYSTTLRCLDLLTKIDATRSYKDEEMMMVIFTTCLFSISNFPLTSLKIKVFFGKSLKHKKCKKFGEFEFSRTFSLLLFSNKKCGKIQIEISHMSKKCGKFKLKVRKSQKSKISRIL